MRVHADQSRRNWSNENKKETQNSHKKGIKDITNTD